MFILYFYLFLRMHDVRWLPITLVCVVHNDVCFVCVLGLAMVYGELQRLRSDGSSTVVVDSNDDVVRSMIRCVRILYSSTADWHRCTCCLLSWIVVVIRLMYVSMCRMDGYIVRWFEFLLLRWRWMMHMTCAFFDVCNFLSTGHGVFIW